MRTSENRPWATEDHPPGSRTIRVTVVLGFDVLNEVKDAGDGDTWICGLIELEVAEQE